MDADQTVRLEAETAAAEATVVGEIVAVELAEALDSLWMALDDKLVYHGISEETVAAALRPYGLSEAWLREWCGAAAGAARGARTNRELTADERAVLEAFRRHRSHPASDSLYGRCVRCGMPWGAQARGQALLDELNKAG